MVAVTITKVALGEDASIKKVKFGEEVDVGDSVYLDSAAGSWKLANAITSTATAGEDGIAIAITPSEQGDQYGVIVTSGTIYISTGLTEGGTYIVGGGASGDINPDADGASGWYKTVLGVAKVEETNGTFTYDEFIMQPLYSGQQV